MKVELSTQVVESVKRQAPEPRRLLRAALRDLAQDHGDIKPLEGPLEGYCRLRVHGYRIIFSYAERSIQCVFAERRGIVYEVFARALAETLSGEEK